MQEIERFDHAVLNSLMAHIAVLDHQGNILAVNDAWRRFAVQNHASVQLREGIGFNYLSVCRNAVGAAAEGARECLEGLLSVLDGSLTEFELEYPCHSPVEQRWFLMRVVPLIEPKYGLVISHINISERRRMENALRESREQVELLLDSTAEAIFGLNPNGECTFCNPATLNLLGYQRSEQLLGKPLHGLIHHTRPDGSVYPQEQCQIYKAFRQGKGTHVDDELLWRADGSSFPAEYWSYPILSDGEVVGAVVTFLDITERKRAAQEVQHVRSYLRNIVDSMPSILVGIDLEGKVTEWNQEAERVTGVAADAAWGRHFVELMPWSEALAQRVNESIWQRQTIRAERLVTEAEGEMHYSDVVIYPLMVEGEVTGAVLRLEDITRRVRLEQMLVQTEKMMSLGGLAAGMAHELNNPLGTILQGSQNILRRLSPDLPANQRAARALGTDLEKMLSYLRQRKIVHFVEDLCEAARRASLIVSDMLTFSNFRPNDAIPARLSELLDRAIRLADNDYDLKKQYDFRQIQIVREYDAELDLVRCSPTSIQQVMLNIIKNAAQAMVEAGTPPPQRIVLRTRREAGWALVEIEDNGPGMNEKIRARVFEPFFTTKPVGVGTGLGLSVSYFIITEQHGGSLSVSSTLGKGTCFAIRLPVRDH